MGKEDDVRVSLVGRSLHVLHHAGDGLVTHNAVSDYAVRIVGVRHRHALAHHLVVTEEHLRHAAGNDDTVGHNLPRQRLSVWTALNGTKAMRLEKPLVLVVEKLREADGARGVVGQCQRAPVVEIEVGPQIVGREADGCHFGQAGQLVADDVDSLSLLLGDDLSLRRALAADDTHLPHAEMVFFELSRRYAEVGGVERGDEEVDDGPAQACDDDDFGKYPAVLLLVSPKTLQYHIHLF